MNDDTQNEFDSPQEPEISAERTADAASAEESAGAPDPVRLADELNQTKDQLLRKVAEFENFRRRTREEQAQLIRYGNEGLILDLIPILDDFERSLKAGQDHTDFDAFYKGVEILRNKFLAALEKRGLKAIETSGGHFDETYHEALMQVPGTGKEPGAVIDEVEKGYMLNEKVIRHAKVTVAADE